MNSCHVRLQGSQVVVVLAGLLPTTTAMSIITSLPLICPSVKVSSIYKDPSIGNLINIVVVKLVILSNELVRFILPYSLCPYVSVTTLQIGRYVVHS